jgi:hypothetical protein
VRSSNDYFEPNRDRARPRATRLRACL